MPRMDARPNLESRKEFHSQGVEGKLIGHSDSPKGWIFLGPEIKVMTVLCNAAFYEDILTRKVDYLADLESFLLPVNTFYSFVFM